MIGQVRFWIWYEVIRAKERGGASPSQYPWRPKAVRTSSTIPCPSKLVPLREKYVATPCSTGHNPLDQVPSCFFVSREESASMCRAVRPSPIPSLKAPCIRSSSLSTRRFSQVVVLLLCWALVGALLTRVWNYSERDTSSNSTLCRCLCPPSFYLAETGDGS